MHGRLFAVTCALAAASLVAPSAQACGVSASGVSSCSLEEHNEAVRPHWAVGASGVYTSTSLRFSGGLHADEVRYGVSSTLAYLPTPRWVLQAGVGVTFGGTLSVPDGRHDFSPGPLALIAADYRAFDNGRTFLLLTSLFSFSAAHTHLGNQASIGYQAADLRLGGEFGVVLADVLRPYALARVFGGPIYWRYAGASVTGTDTHHYQLGAGLALRITRTLNASVEGVPLGERAVAVGVGAAF